VPAHHSAVTPEAPRVEVAKTRPLAVRQQPHLWRQGVLPVPAVHPQNGQPELAPGSDVGCTTPAVHLEGRAAADSMQVTGAREFGREIVADAWADKPRAPAIGASCRLLTGGGCVWHGMAMQTIATTVAEVRSMSELTGQGGHMRQQDTGVYAELGSATVQCNAAGGGIPHCRQDV
jgi:hypothetical protein